MADWLIDFLTWMIRNGAFTRFKGEYLSAVYNMEAGLPMLGFAPLAR